VLTRVDSVELSVKVQHEARRGLKVVIFPRDRDGDDGDTGLDGGVQLCASTNAQEIRLLKRLLERRFAHLEQAPRPLENVARLDDHEAVAVPHVVEQPGEICTTTRHRSV